MARALPDDPSLISAVLVKSTVPGKGVGIVACELDGEHAWDPDRCLRQGDYVSAWCERSTNVWFDVPRESIPDHAQ